MSSHDARYEDSSAYDDEPGTTTTRTDQQVVDRDGMTTDAAAVHLPADPGPEPTPDDRATAPDSAPVTITDADQSPEFSSRGSTDVRAADTDVKSDTTDAKFDTTDATSDTTDVKSDTTDASVGPDTETGALKDPVPDGTFSADTSAASASAGSATASSTDIDWRDLQGRFVDDPEATVREAGALVEKALSDLRTRAESGSTEDLRTAFRRYRDLYTGLS
jgi:hypothetical protein